MRTISTVLAAILYITSPAQQVPEMGKYFDKDWVEVKEPSKAFYYRIVEQSGDGYVVTDYYKLTDKPQMRAECKEVSPKLVNHGLCTWYYANGQKKREGNYEDGKRAGIFKAYYDDGNLNSVVTYRKEEPRYIQAYTPAGEPLLKDGSGMIDARYSLSEDEESHYSEIRDSLLIGSYRIRQEKQDTVYLVAENVTEYVGGMPGFYQDLARALQGKYPKDARRRGIEGRVFIQFIIDKYGNMKESTVIRGIGGGCDEVALQAFATMKQWKPALHHEKPVQQMLVLPVVFRLK